MSKQFNCICEKNYKSRQSLYVHRKKCKLYLDQNPIKPSILENQNTILMNMMSNLLQPIPQSPIIQPEPRKKPDFCLETYLNVNCSNAYNLNDIWTEIIFNADYNDWLLNIDNGKEEEFQILKYLNISAYPTGNFFFIDFFLNPFSKIPHLQKPVFCSDTKRNIYYVKNEGVWTKIFYNELINKIYKKIVNKPMFMLNYIFSSTQKKLTEKQFYQVYPNIKDFYEIKSKNFDKLILNFCNTTPDGFMFKFNSALKKISGKDHVNHIPATLDACESFIDEQNYSDEEEE